MVDPLLIAPDNRLLGWALSDLTLYGGQPVADVVIGRAGTEGSATLPPSALATTGAGPDLGAPEGDIAASETTALLDAQAGGIPAPLGAAPAPLIQIPPVAPAAAPEPPSVPQPVGAGSFVQSPVATPLQTVQANTPPLASAPPATSSAPSPIADPIPSAPVSIVPEGIAAVSQASVAIADAATPALDVVTTLADRADAVVADLTGPVAATAPVVEAAVGAVAEAVNVVVAAAETLPATVTAATNAATAAIDAVPIESFSGTDPAAGLSTLVGMVESSEAFDIIDGPVAPAETPQVSILDTLAADEAPSPLLGGVDDADSPLDDVGSHLGL